MQDDTSGTRVWHPSIPIFKRGPWSRVSGYIGSSKELVARTWWRPTDIVLSNNTIIEAQDGATVGTLTGVDPNKKDLLTFSTTDPRFEIGFSQTGQNLLQLKDNVQLDYEGAPTTSVVVKVTDQAGLSYTETFNLTVTDVA
jgi:hypothetical protein